MTTANTIPANVTLRGSEYRRIGTPVYRVQVQSYNGGFLSTAVATRERSEVGAIAAAQADLLTGWAEARRSCFADAILVVTDQELVGIDGYNKGRAATLSTYRWDPTMGRWAHSTGARINALD